jgi:hypothetical protein
VAKAPHSRSRGRQARWPAPQIFGLKGELAGRDLDLNVVDTDDVTALYCKPRVDDACAVQ